MKKAMGPASGIVAGIFWKYPEVYKLQPDSLMNEIALTIESEHAKVVIAVEALEFYAVGSENDVICGTELDGNCIPQPLGNKARETLIKIGDV